MEIRKGIADPIRGERVVAVDPPFVPDGQTGWKRRLNLYTGRSLSASALETEQKGRAGRMTTRAQSVSHGVVTGLEIGLEILPNAGDGLQSAFLTLAPGYGVAASGDDVLIPSARRLPIAGIPVSGVEVEGGAPTFARLSEAGALQAVAPVGVLRLRPVILPATGEFDEFDACVEPEADAAFEDQQLADAVILEYVPLSASIFSGNLPELAATTPAAINRWRNQVAYSIFTLDAATIPPDVLAWEEDGVPLGVIGFDANWTPVFVDRASVVRGGGKPRRRSRLQPERGSVFLWQARLEQLAEQIAQLQFDGTPTPAIGPMMNYLPPAGIIPADAFEFRAGAPLNHFFPAHFGVDAVPIPLDQLDVAFEASAALDPYDTRYTDYVRLLVPVPAQLYEPRLMQQETIDPIFDETITSFRARRDTLLGRRLLVRDIYQVYRKAIYGKIPDFPHDTTSGDEAPAAPPFDPEEQAYGTEPNSDGKPQIPALDQLVQDLVVLIQEANVSSEGELNLRRDGLKEYIRRLKQTADAADDNIDLGFLRVQTDIYRVRQLVMGKDVASKLVTSPALAAIVSAEVSSYATRHELSDYLATAKARGIEPVDRAIGLDAFTAFRPTFEIEKPLPQIASFDLFKRPIEGARVPPAFEVLAPKPPPPPEEIENQSPVVGSVANLRDTTIGQRLERSGAVDAKDNTRASQFEIVSNLASSPIFAGLEVPIVSKYEQSRVVYENVPVHELRDNPARLFDVNQPGDDEVSYFNAGIDVIDVSVAALRAAEARMKKCRDAVILAEAALKRFQETAQQVDLRLRVIGDDLAEARHDVGVAVALRDEEQARLDGINARRRQVLRDHVRFLGYMRPRTTATCAATPQRRLDPGAVPSIVPVCLNTAQFVPAELRAVVDLFRDVPIRWLVQMPRLLDRLDRVELLQELMVTGIARAKSPARSRGVLFQNSSFGDNLGQAIARTYVAQQQTTAGIRSALAEFDPLTLRGRTWKQLRDVAADTASLDDLVDAGHGKSDVAQRALAELDDMAQVAACLYARFAEVRPVLRLRWAETLSQYDEPVNLRSLTGLQGWGEIEVLDRRQMQQLVDWLHNAVDASALQAVAMINDLIRVCLLLASHAPVNQLITARVAQATSVLPGKPLTLNVDLGRVKIGMNVLIYDREEKSRVVAQAVIDDMNDRVATARVVSTVKANLLVDTNTTVVVTSALELTKTMSMQYVAMR